MRPWIFFVVHCCCFVATFFLLLLLNRRWIFLAVFIHFFLVGCCCNGLTFYHFNLAYSTYLEKICNVLLGFYYYICVLYTEMNILWMCAEPRPTWSFRHYFFVDIFLCLGYNIILFTPARNIENVHPLFLYDCNDWCIWIYFNICMHSSEISFEHKFFFLVFCVLGVNWVDWCVDIHIYTYFIRVVFFWLRRTLKRSSTRYIRECVFTINLSQAARIRIIFVIQIYYFICL